MTAAATKNKTNGAAKKPSAAAKPPAKAKPKPSPVAASAVFAAPVTPAPVETDVAHERRPLGSVWREPRSNVRRSRTNPRTVFVLDDLLETMEVRREDGTKEKRQLSPVLVRFRPDTDSGTDYEIIDGERRDRAAEALGWDDIEIKLVEMTDEEVEEAQLVANLARADLTPLDEAHAFERLERKGYSIAQISDRVGKPQSYIRQRLALAKLTDEAKAALRDGAISVGAAQELAAVTDPAAQRGVVARALEGRAPGADPMSAKQIRIFVEQAMLVLSKAKFSLDDATLVPAAGACSSCPKRSSQQFALIALTGAGVADDERCTDRSCFVAKQEAHWTRAKCDALAVGQTVIEGDAARKVVAFGGVAKDSGYVDLDAHCAELRDGRTWREVLGEDALPTSLVRGDGGAPHVIASKADAVRLLRERGLLRAPGVAPASTTQTDAAASQVSGSANDTAPAQDAGESTEDGEPETPLLSPDQIARAAKRASLDSDTFAMLVEATIYVANPTDKETSNIGKPYDVPVPSGSNGAEIVIGILRGLTSDGERIALLSRVMCTIDQRARRLLSDYFAKPVNIDDAKMRALNAIRGGARKAAHIRAAAGIDDATWPRVASELKTYGLVRVTGSGRGLEYTPAEEAQGAAESAVTESTDAAEQRDPDATADGEPAALYAPSAVEEGIRDAVRDMLRSQALQRAELATQLADLEGITESDADREIETLLEEGFLVSNGECIEWAADRSSSATGQRQLF